MKKAYTLLVIALIAVGVFGCKKEKDPYDSRSLVGKWTRTKRIFTQSRDGVEFNNKTTTDDGLYLQFNADSSGVFSNGTNNASFKWNILRDQLTLTQKFGEKPYDVLYSAYTIQTLTNNELHILSEYRYTKEDNAKWVDISDEYYTR